MSTFGEMAKEKCDMPCENSEGNIHKLSVNECEILKFRFYFPITALCNEHYKDHFSRYPGWYKRCSDPNKRHKKVVKSNLKEISLETAQKVKQFTEFCVIPGQKLCKYCEKFVLETAQKAQESEKDCQQEKKESDMNICSLDSSDTDSSPNLSLLYNLSIVNNALDILGIKNILEHQSTNTNFITKKIEEITTVVHQMIEGIPPKDVGKQILNNFISQFEELSGADKYRVLRSIPKDTSSEF